MIITKKLIQLNNFLEVIHIVVDLEEVEPSRQDLAAKLTLRLPLTSPIAGPLISAIGVWKNPLISPTGNRVGPLIFHTINRASPPISLHGKRVGPLIPPTCVNG